MHRLFTLISKQSSGKLRPLFSLSQRTHRPPTLTLTSGGYPMFTGLTMSARISSAEKKISTMKMLKLTGNSLR